MKACQDCEDPIFSRRMRCKRCGLLVCRWCYHHVHLMHIEIDRAKGDSK